MHLMLVVIDWLYLLILQCSKVELSELLIEVMNM